MSSVKNAVAAVTTEKIIKRSTNYTVRHELKQREDESHAHSGQVMSNIDSAALHASLNQSRQTWTHHAFSKFSPGSDGNAKGLQQLQPHTSATSALSLAGVCTVRIGPHMFLDTKFYTVLNPPASASQSTAKQSALLNGDNANGGPGSVKTEPSTASSHQLMRPLHQVVMEFKENPGTLWVFPEEASLEFTPASEREAAQIAASFCLPVPERPESGVQKSEPLLQATTMVILHVTTALREGLELAVKGIHTTSRSSTNLPRNPTSRPHTSSTYSEDPSEVLGSGKQATNNNNALPAKRKLDTTTESQKSAKPKRPKDFDDKSPGPSAKKTTVVSGSKKNGISGSSSTQQKRCGYCNCTVTPMWRRGPNGPSTLCNACGVKWKHGKILQDPSDTLQRHDAATSATSASPTPSLPSDASPSSAVPRSLSSKTTKERLENGHTRRTEDKKPQNKTSSKKLFHVHEEKSGDPFSTKESNNVSRVQEAEKIVPVKKRLSGKVTPVNPPGPRMVPIHELGDPTKTPSTFPTSPRKYGHEDEKPLPSNGRIKAKKSGVIHDDHTVSTTSSSISSGSILSVIHDTGMDKDKDAEVTATSRPVDDSLYVTKNLYTNNTATFPLHFPTISIAFGPNNATYVYPNCAVVLYENHFQIKLIQAGERTEIDVWKEGIEGTEFKVVDMGDGESMIIMKALLRQYLTRFDKELLNPKRDESLIVFRFRERLDGGGPSVKPLLEHWLATDIPVPPPTSNDSVEA
ncbi:hypothetical protein EDD21DRAFT_350012 [Dissophora ornata]|nr:hypothetical protein EDD21DRAFT_350012 [Dissophora ornata]